MEREKMIQLVTAAQQGDANAMEDLFSAYYQDVFDFARHTVKDKNLAADITQESFLEVINTLDKLQEPAAFKKWLRQITYHQCTRYFKKKTELQGEEDEDGNSVFDNLVDDREDSIPSDVYEKEEFRQTILNMVAELSEQQRAAVMLYYYDELSIDEVAQIQGVSPGTVKSRLNYARKALKTSVETYEKKHGIKLHAFAPLPLLLFAIRSAAQSMPQGTVQAMRTTLGIGTAAAGTVAAGGAATAAGTAASGSAAAAGTATSVKVIAAVAASAVVAATATGVILGMGGSPEPGSYASQQMEIHRQNHLVAQDGNRYFGQDYQYMALEDGRCFYLSEEEAPAEQHAGENASNFFCSGDALAYTDADGVQHLPYYQDELLLVGVPGQIRAKVSTFSNKVHIISADENGVWASCINKETNEMVYAGLPLYVKANITLTHEQIRDFQLVPAAFLSTGYCFITDDGFYYGEGFSIAKDGDQVKLTMHTLKSAKGRILDYEYGSPGELPMYISDEDGNVYINGNEAVPLPEGYTSEDLVQAICGQPIVMRFRDGSVYTWDRRAESATQHKLLSALGNEEHIRELYISSYHYGGKIMALMDDNTLYTVVGDLPDQPEETEGNIS